MKRTLSKLFDFHKLHDNARIWGPSSASNQGSGVRASHIRQKLPRDPPNPFQARWSAFYLGGRKCSWWTPDRVSWKIRPFHPQLNERYGLRSHPRGWWLHPGAFHPAKVPLSGSQSHMVLVSLSSNLHVFLRTQTATHFGGGNRATDLSNLSLITGFFSGIKKLRVSEL